MSRVVGGAEGNVHAVVTSVVHPNEAVEHGQAISAIIVGGAAVRNSNATHGGVAPSRAARAQALASHAVVMISASDWDVVAGIAGSTPGSSGVESQTLSAAIVGCAARGNGDAGVHAGAPGRTGCTSATVSGTIIIGGTSCGNGITRVSCGAPNVAWQEG